MKEKIRAIFHQYIIELRKARDSKFLFLPRNIELSKLSRIFLYEISGKNNKADNLMISAVLDDLISKSILISSPVEFETYKIGDCTYYDVRLKTIDNKSYCRGTSTDIAEAFAKAFGEVFERSSIKFPNLDEVTYRRLKDIRGNNEFIDFGILPKPTEEQLEKFPNSRIVDSDEFSFVKARRISDNKEIFIPTQNIFYGKFTKKKEKDIIESTTHGAGAGWTSNDAFRSCLFEIMHRHFFLDSWFKKISQNKIDLETIPENSELRKKIRNFQSQGFVIHILDYSKEASVPTTICLLEKDGFYCGGATAFMLSAAIERSIDEAFSIYWWLVNAKSKGYLKLTSNYVDSIGSSLLDESITIFEKLMMFGGAYYSKKVDKFFINGKPVPYTEEYNKNVDLDLKELAIRTFGNNVFHYIKKNEYLNEYDYHVAKVYIPNSYYFPLNETLSRPILADGIRPKYNQINPFP